MINEEDESLTGHTFANNMVDGLQNAESNESVSGNENNLDECQAISFGK